MGLDLAGVETRPTGFCVLIDMTVKTSHLYTDKEILDSVAVCKPNIIAIDAPLCLPPGRKTVEERTNCHLRECDRALLKMGIKLFPVTLGPMRKLTVRGIHLKGLLEGQGFTVIEVYPGGAQDVLGIPRKQKGLGGLCVGLEGLGIKGLSSKMSDHELDAATCAYVGKLFVDGDAAAYGKPDQSIVMPKGKPSKSRYCKDR